MVNLPSQSAIPGALVQLLAVAVAAFPPGTTVYYGEDLPAYTAPLTLQISEITGDQTWAELGNFRREEVFSFTCSLITYVGGVPDWVAQLVSTFASFATLSKAIGTNPTLNGSVRVAEVGNFITHSETDANAQGATTLDFSVRCSQRVTSLT